MAGRKVPSKIARRAPAMPMAGSSPVPPLPMPKPKRKAAPKLGGGLGSLMGGGAPPTPPMGGGAPPAPPSMGGGIG